MTYSQRAGFSPVVVLALIRSEIREGYRPARSAGLTFDPWWQADPDCQTASAYQPVAVAW